jgi:hypothetical protein
MGERGRSYFEQHFDGRRLAGVLLQTLEDVALKRRECA